MLRFAVRKPGYFRLHAVQKSVRQRTWRAHKRAGPIRCTSGMVGTARSVLRGQCHRC